MKVIFYHEVIYTSSSLLKYLKNGYTTAYLSDQAAYGEISSVNSSKREQLTGHHSLRPLFIPIMEIFHIRIR